LCVGANALVFKLKFAVQVVSVIGSSASQQDDSHSHQVAAATLAAVVPAWLQAGKPLAQLAAAVVAPLADLLPHRRLALLTALIAVVPQVKLAFWVETLMPIFLDRHFDSFSAGLLLYSSF